MTSNISIPLDDWQMKSNDYGFYQMEAEYGLMNLSDLLQDLTKENEQYSMNITIYAIVLIIMTYIINFLIILIIVSEKDLRNQSMYICIVNYCVINLVFNIYVTPMAVYMELQPMWELGKNACKSWIIMDVLLPFTCFLVFILMTVDRFILVWRYSFHSKMRGTVQNIVYILIPWFISAIVIIPIWIHGEKHIPEMEEISGLCIFMLEFEPSVASPIVSYFLPSIFVLFMMVLIIINNFLGASPERDPYMHSVTSRSVEMSVPTNLLRYNDSFSLSTLYLANCFFIVMWFPHQFISLLLAFCQSCYPPYSLILGFTWLGSTASASVPLVWFLDSRIRRRVRSLTCKLFTKRPSSNPEGTDVHLMEM